MAIIIRNGRDDDAPAFIELITRCWAEYPGCFMDVEGENPELLALASHFDGVGGRLWVAEESGGMVGMVATRPLADGCWELCRMYLHASARGTGVADGLLRTAVDHTRSSGAHRMRLWSDTRFDRAHRFYERHGFVRDGGIKPLMDASNTIDFGYSKPSAGLFVSALDAAAAASASRAMGQILVECVADGASVSFLPGLERNDAEAFYRWQAKHVAAGNRILLAAWLEGDLAACVMVNLHMPQNQSHRAEIEKLLVKPTARRRGLARALMQAAEKAAVGAGRTLLTLDTRGGDSAETLYRTLGWTAAGTIPAFARSADGGFDATIMFYKQISP